MVVDIDRALQNSEPRSGGVLAEINDELGQLADKVGPSLVQVQAGRRGAGAGVVVHEAGLVITNAHVARSKRLQVVDWQGNKRPAMVRAWHGSLDLAALTLESGELPPLALANSRNLQPGNWVLAMGHPFGVSVGATAGVVIGVGRHLPEAPTGGHDWLAMSLHLRPGHSGGPVVDAAGQLVGVNARMAGLEVGLAIPSHLISQFLKEAFSDYNRRPQNLANQQRAHWF